LHKKHAESLQESLSSTHHIDKEHKEIDRDEKETSAGTQVGTGQMFDNDEFVNKIAALVTKKIAPRLPETIWNNFNLTSPNTAMITSSKTDPPLHYANRKSKDDENDIYGNSTLEHIQLI
jgi:hypothetical protein